MEIKEKFGGVIVPMISPLTNEFEIDKYAVHKIIKSFIEVGIKPFIIGTTGEAASLTWKLKLDLVKETVEAVNGQKLVFTGIIGNSVLALIEEAKKYADLGVDALVVSMPNYYPISESQMIQFVEKIADSIPLPIFLYNIPATAHLSIPLEVINKLSYHPNILGIKDSERNLQRLEESLELWKTRDDFIYLVGWAAKSVEGLRKGASGIVPGTGNLCPGLYSQLFDAVKKGNDEFADFMQTHTNQISSLYQQGRDLSHSLAALKVLLSMKNLCGTKVLLPLSQMAEQEEIEFRKIMLLELRNLNV
jgi:dihydrodipicolinate synthase/N-acetylneuraminate lyase